MRQAALLLLLAACTREQEVRPGEPELGDLPSVLAFGEVTVGTSATLTWQLRNEGIGDLSVEASFTGGDELELVRAPTDVMAGAAGEIVLRYAPQAEGPDEGVLELQTNAGPVSLPVSGTGVLPVLEAAPRALYFGNAPGRRSLELRSTGSGAVVVDDIEPSHIAFEWQLPSSLPLTLEPGHAVTLDVDYSGPDPAVDGTLVLHSNDPERPELTVALYGGDGPPAAPEVSITAPTWGSAWLTDEILTLTASAVDPDDPPDTLAVLLYVDGSLRETATPDALGGVIFDLGTLSAGEHVLKARAIDPDGGLGEDEVTVDVQDPAEPLRYVVSGGDSPYQYLTVDDDLALFVDGTAAFVDDDGHQTTLAPIAIAASRGSSLRIVATDVNECRRAIDELVLHFGTARSQALVDATSASACEADSDYDPAYTGPWPNDFLDVTVEVALP